MCGIAGYILKDPSDRGGERIRSFLQALRQRGPDDQGVCLALRRSGEWRHFGADQLADFRNEDGVPWHDTALVHTRFAIIDPTPAGHQPFVTADGRLTLVFNGEIYNYHELRLMLQKRGAAFRTRTDTEVLAEGYRLLGDDLWPLLNGFWAVAVLDRAGGHLTLARDRLGVAPLYYRETAEGLFFCSYIQPLLDLALSRSRMDEEMVRGYLETGLKDFDGRTFYRDVRSFPAAASWTAVAQPRVYDPGRDARHFWSLPQRPFTVGEITFKEAVDQFRQLFMDAVTLRLRADVPMALELSGGLDSSAVCAAAASLSGRPLTAYTLHVHGRDETPFAREACRHISARHGLKLVVLERVEHGFDRQAESFTRLMEEPYDTPGNYLHHRMLQRIRADGFKGVLTGAGGDEVLAGYEASFWPGIYAAARAGEGMPLLEADRYEFIRRYSSWPRLLNTTKGFGRSLAARWPGGRFFNETPQRMLTAAEQYARRYRSLRPFHQRLYHVEVGLLPYYLRSTDHYTMGVPMEHRFPFLDYRLVEFGLRLPAEYLFHRGWTKYLLRRAMEGWLPPAVLWRRDKMGFPFDFSGYFAGRALGYDKYLKALARFEGAAENTGRIEALARRGSGEILALLIGGDVAGAR